MAAMKRVIGVIAVIFVFTCGVMDAAAPTPAPVANDVIVDYADEAFYFYNSDDDSNTPRLAMIYEEVRMTRRFLVVIGGAFFGWLICERVYRYL